MIATIFIACLVAIGAGLAGVVMALRLERKVIRDSQAEHEAWEQAQENTRRGWERKQLKRYTEQEKRLTDTIQEIHSEWEKIKQQSVERNTELTRQYEELEQRVRLEQELAGLPHVEDVPLGEDSAVLLARSQWHPAKLRGADLRGRDLSHRYLRSSDLREAQLKDANLFMADLSGALLTGANLCGADLSGANLSGADLRDAILIDANLQVADLQHALLAGANLIGARHLTNKQVAAAHLDEMSRVEDDTSLTEPQLPIVRISQPLAHAPQQPAPASEAAENSNGYHAVSQPTIEQLIPETPLPAAPDERAMLDEMEPAAIDQELDNEAMPLVPLMEDESDGGEPVETAPVQTGPTSQELLALLPTGEAIGSESIETTFTEPEAIPTAPAPVIFDEPHEDEQTILSPEEPETAFTASPILTEVEDAAYDNLLPDLESLLASSTSPEFFSPLAPNDSLLDLQVTDSIVEQPEQGQAEVADNTEGHAKRNRSRHARTTKR